MPQLLLIKHALPEINPDIPSPEWPLSEEGRQQAQALARRLSSYNLTHVVTSREPKARETGEIVAKELFLSCSVGENLQENDRTGFGYLGMDAFKAAFASFFAKPEELIIGNETARQARERFTKAVESMVALYPDDTLAIVTHGTVLSLFVAAFNPVKPFDLWNRLTCPAFVELTLPDYRLLQVVEQAA